jgi:hypothetical protein
MSWQEAMELKAGLKERTPVDVDVTINNALYPLLEKHLQELPDGLRQKALNEKKLIDENKNEMLCVLLHSLSQDNLTIESDLVGSLAKLI